MLCQHGCHSVKEQEVYSAVRTTHCVTETIDKKRKKEKEKTRKKKRGLKGVPPEDGSPN